LIQRAWGWISDVGAVSPDDERGRRFGLMGTGSCISFPPGAVFGERWIHIGARTLIGPHVSMSAGMWPGQVMDHDPVISIGERCNIGRGSCIVGHRSIEIGDDVTTGPYVYITDQNHVYADVDRPIADQYPTEDPVVIGAGCWLGTGAIVLPGARIGRNVAVAAGCVVAGAPARVVRRHTEHGWDPPLKGEPVTPPAGWPR
jgi:acetyltransferase-like isoleucine patch superfamily enzyme